MTKTEKSKIRQKETRKDRIEIDKMIKNESYIEWLKTEHGVMDLDEIRTDKQFFNDMVKEIERSRERTIVYDKDYQRSDLDEWLKKRDRKLLLRMVSEKAKLRRDKAQMHTQSTPFTPKEEKHEHN